MMLVVMTNGGQVVETISPKGMTALQLIDRLTHSIQEGLRLDKEEEARR
jgi:hypothetical protein